MKAFGLIDIMTGEVIGKTVFPTMRNAKLSVRNNYFHRNIGVAEVEIKPVGETHFYNYESKKWVTK